ncbi:F0F1 ATP synthase subunit epsilon [Mesonia aestuariivivens]|uniref:F0F1 ATP synthase subunit epsilon n=1 Tax=Mesonia aestuariivivens TaxID=2796128 RepID=A0ABS6VXF6_9FLAO|nr:F0F1 ATP synthase subunit epsilon [Mesonia aestuariivivens]MBW2960277.1 F0F1 ATP synthase subunit epsilon [Mesonia aestuariivivens]
MYLEIVSPERVLLSAEVNSVTVPGIDGEFQMLNNHAPIVSVLDKGVIKVEGNLEIPKELKDVVTKAQDGKWYFPIKGGVLEMKNNKAIVLAD